LGNILYYFRKNNRYICYTNTIAMDLAARKYKFIERLLKVANSDVLDKLEIILNTEAADDDFVSNLPKPIQRLLEQSEKDSEDGLVFSHEDVMDEIRAKYNLS